jgi:hypothetical protein
MNLWDLKPLKSIFGYGVQVLRMEPGDILILRPNEPAKTEDLKRVSESMKQILPEGTKAYIAPANWEIAVARPAEMAETIDGLTELQKALGA